MKAGEEENPWLLLNDFVRTRCSEFGTQLIVCSKRLSCCLCATLVVQCSSLVDDLLLNGLVVVVIDGRDDWVVGKTMQLAAAKDIWGGPRGEGEELSHIVCGEGLTTECSEGAELCEFS